MTGLALNGGSEDLTHDIGAMKEAESRSGLQILTAALSTANCVIDLG